MESRLLKILLLCAALGLCPSLVSSDVSGTDLPDFGDSSGSLISPTQELEFGEAFMRSVRAQATLVSDPDLNRYIRRLGDRLVGNSDAPGYPFTFFIVQDSAINAFAGPGGYIGVHTGLILAARNESELAGVMAHEIAHVTQRHLLRAYEAANQLSLPTAAATIAAILLGVATNSDAGIAAASAIQAGSIQYQLNFTRANEKEADRIGIQTLGRSGIDPFGMPSFFERLYQSTRLYGAANIPEFLSTHPVTTDRIAESMQRAEQQGRGKELDSLEFQLQRARLEVLLALVAQDPVEARVAELTELDLLLTDAFLMAGSHVVSGQIDPTTLEPTWIAVRREVDLVEKLNTALETGDVTGTLDSLFPDHEGYRRLRDLARRYTELVEAGGWEMIGQGPTLKPGDQDPRVGSVRRRLKASGDLAEDLVTAAPSLYDEDLEAALRGFQVRHGLESDGVVGP
jgi:predicted Zn-dependent protease